MNILIISRTPWDNNNSFGNTFTNLFNGMQNVNIYNICCQSGMNNNSVVKKAYMMSETMLIKGILGKPTGIVSESSYINEKSHNKDFNIIKKFSLIRTNIAFIIRDLIWMSGVWKDDNLLDDFLKEANPDVIYIPIYSSWYMCDVQNYFIKRLGVKVAGHISDDVYGYPRGYLCSPLTCFYRWILRSKIRKLISKTEYLDVFAENMKTEYESIFKKSCYVIGKGVHKSEIVQSNSLKTNSPIRFVYTGNIGTGRYKTLCDIAIGLGKFNETSSAVLEVYTETPLTKTMKNCFDKCKNLKFMGAVSSHDVQKIQKAADWLVHVESFTKKAICQTKMSFSTKIIDYMLVGRPILAVGPKSVNSISFLRENSLAATACSHNEINEVLFSILRSECQIEKMGEKVTKYLLDYRDIEKIQLGIFDRLSKIAKK